jgi:aryl-alcohol dehydrogenase-like predicted oxidoreductase
MLLGTLGLGTYLGPADDATDARYLCVLAHAFRSGVNVIDTASTYRHGRSERVVGRALSDAFSAGILARDEVLVCTKGGFLGGAGRGLVRRGLLRETEVAGGRHSLVPAFLAHQIDQCRGRLRLGTLDLFLLHNPELQLRARGRRTFLRVIGGAFEALEDAASRGAIRGYGVASWDGFSASVRAPDLLRLDDLLEVASRVAGSRHHFRAVQVPLNLAMLDVFQRRNQGVRRQPISLLAAAAGRGLFVMTSSPFLQGRLVGALPAPLRKLLGPGTDADRSLRFVRSARGVGTTLAGTTKLPHLDANLRVVRGAALTPEAMRELLGRSGQNQHLE